MPDIKAKYELFINTEIRGSYIFIRLAWIRLSRNFWQFLYEMTFTP